MDDLRLFVHLLAAAIWVGGQLVLGALVPPSRPGRSGQRSTRVLAC